MCSMHVCEVSASTYTCREHGLTTKAVKKALHRTFRAMDAEIIAAEKASQNPDAEHAGTTASIALQLGTQLYVADVGERVPWFQQCSETDRYLGWRHSGVVYLQINQGHGCHVDAAAGRKHVHQAIVTTQVHA